MTLSTIKERNYAKERRKNNKILFKKAKLEIVRKICANYETGQHTLESCCKNSGVPYRTFRDWWIRYENESENEGGKWHFFAEVAALWEDAQRQHRTEVSNELVCKAETALHKSITGWEYEETITVGRRSIDKNGEITFIPIGIKKTKKYKAPSDSAIQFALKKLKPEIYGDIKTSLNTDVYYNQYKEWSLEKIVAEIERLSGD